MPLRFKVVIPARYASSRFPGKPLADICGKTMLQHVYECAQKSAAEQVVIATDDSRIESVAKQFGADVCMTSADHPTGTDRLAEVCLKYNWHSDDIVVNLQGDEPLTPVELLNQVAKNLSAHEKAGMATLSTQIKSIEEINDPNIVKVVSDAQGYALYFSRAAIPFNRDSDVDYSNELLKNYHRHLGIYAYRVAFLNAYADMEPCALESLEKLEQLRALHNGIAIHVQQACCLPGPGIDTPEDLVTAAKLICK